MVTVDCHLHLTETPSQVPDWWMTEMYRPFGGVFGSTDGAWMVDLLDRSGVDVGLVQGADIRRTTWHPDFPEEHEVFVPNDYTAEQVALFPDRLKGVVCVDPIRDVAAALEEIDRCVLELDFRAVKLVAAYQHYSPNDRRLDPIYERCIDLDVPVHIFTGWTPTITAKLVHADPVLIDEVGRRYRDLKLIVALGVPWIDQSTLMVAKHPNFYADLYHYSEMGPEPLYGALEKFRSLSALDRVLYGSNNSDKVRVGREESTVPDVYRSVNEVAERRGAPPFSDDEMEAILGGSAARIYKIGA
ncbi:MAG: amidohydrolase [Acidimicrobiia bacterium]|nr:amidohydrolase [Acidimicrobiia bacterium]MYC84400.1 amidohydrolase [Acidimicrobiia bacterium]